jgi:hypothetical protein
MFHGCLALKAQGEATPFYMNTITPQAEKVSAERKRGHGGERGDGCGRGWEAQKLGWRRDGRRRKLGDEIRRRRSWPPEERAPLSLSILSIWHWSVPSLSALCFPSLWLQIPAPIFFPPWFPLGVCASRASLQGRPKSLKVTPTLTSRRLGRLKQGIWTP